MVIRMPGASRNAIIPNCVAVPEVESNSIISLCVHVQESNLAAVLPENVLRIVKGQDQLRAIRIVEPTAEYTVGLVVQDRDPLPILVSSLASIAETFAAD